MREDSRKRWAVAGIALCFLVPIWVASGQDQAGKSQRRTAAATSQVEPVTGYVEDVDVSVRQPTTPGPEPATSFDPEVAGYGRAAFERSCTACHDAARA